MIKKLSFYMLPVLFLPQFAFAAKIIENNSDKNIVAFLDRVKNYLLLITGSIAVLFIVIGGVQYITSGGNTQKTDIAKKTLSFAITGLILIILARVILGLISQDFFPSIFDDNTMEQSDFNNNF